MSDWEDAIRYSVAAMTRPLCAAHPGPRQCCMTPQLGPHKVGCPASYAQRAAMTHHERALRHEHELKHPQARMFCWFCGCQLDEAPLFMDEHWEDGRALGFCSKPHHAVYQELISLWA